MFEPLSPFLQALVGRGFVHQATDLPGLDRLLCERQGQVTAYVGFDATADSLHVGSLVGLMMLRWLHRTGGSPTALLGTGTTRIGDPSDKATSRPILNNETITNNKFGIKKNIQAILPDARILENGDWLNHLNLIDFLRDVGKHFTLNRMLTMDFVKSRIENQSPLTVLELNYILLQSYDFAQLGSSGCVLQMGGSDQWGNIVNGIELGRKMYDLELFGLTTSLITTSSGKKMGKTEDGAIWLSPEKTTPYDYFQFWRNTDDLDVKKFLCLFTELDISEIDVLMQGDINNAKKRLAFEATSILHGKDAANGALITAESVFGGDGGDISMLPFTLHVDGMTVVDALVSLEFASSKSAARRLIDGKGVKVDDVKISEDFVLPAKRTKISCGKTKHGIVTVI